MGELPGFVWSPHRKEGGVAMALGMLVGGLFVSAAVCGCCGERGLALGVLVLSLTFAAAVAGHLGQGGPF